LPEKQGGLNGGALFVMAAKIVNEKRFSEMKTAFQQQNPGVIDDYTLTSRIQLAQAANIDDYNKIFLNLSAKIPIEQTKLIVIDNILAVCDNFIKADG
jgi:Rad51